MDARTIELVSVPVGAIRIGPRRRPVDTASVRDIAQSIERHGLLQPIGVKPPPEEEIADLHDGVCDLVFGAHRLAACCLLGWQEIDAYLLPEGLADEEYLLIELQENSARNDLTQGQRKAYAAEIGTLLERLASQGNNENFQKKWIVEFSKKTGILERTVLNWWHAFCAETERSITPSQALDLDRQDFFAWLQEQQAREEAEKARRQAEARAARRRQDFADAIENLETLATDYGRTAVIEEVIDVFLQHEG
jgi:ParB/Sulfiredoxin domain